MKDFGRQMLAVAHVFGGIKPGPGNVTGAFRRGMVRSRSNRTGN